MSANPSVDIFCSNLGDALWVTPLARYLPNLTVRIRKGDRRAEATAPIFENLCKVELVDSPNETLKVPGYGHVTQRIIGAWGFEGQRSIPEIRLTEGELAWARSYLNAYKNPIVFINGSSAASLSPRAAYVRPPVAALQALVDHYKTKGFTPIQFGVSAGFYDVDTFEPLNGTVVIRGLSVRQLAACYAIIGKYIGGDTGDYHLVLAVGGHATCLVPQHSDGFGYRHWDLLYDDICWGAEEPRVQYLLHSQWELAKEIYD